MDQNLPDNSTLRPPAAKLLGIYLNDHLAGASGGIELAHRLADAEHGTDLGEQVTALAKEITEDRAALLRIMRSLDVTPHHRFSTLGWTVEKVARLKLNGRLLHRSPLSTLVELEALRLGVLGKHQLWTTLAHTHAEDPRLHTDRLHELQRRAEQQATTLETLRQAAAYDALATVDS
ncbi:hypothetical protein ACEZCY_03845 [Streptacidiphilus sp. N1-12]|uniref:Uncharacterized protein n=2 Tax=Streptacidiphilus alkalitolerans TaxID=3342712 RepID=A0ABV6XE31_9ACTN